MARTSKYYNVTDVDALKAFNSKAVSMEPVVKHLVVMGLLKLFDDVPGIERIAEMDADPATSIEEKIATSENVQELADRVTESVPETNTIPHFIGKKRHESA